MVSDVDSWLIRPLPRLVNTKNGSVRFAFEDSSRAAFTFEVIGDSVKLVIEHDLLASEAAYDLMANYWTSLIAELHSRLDKNL